MVNEYFIYIIILPNKMIFSKQILGSSYYLPAHGWCGARARNNKSVAKKSAYPNEDGSAGGFKGGMPSRPSRSEAPPPARSEQSTAKKFSFPFTCPSKPRRRRGRKNRWRAQNQNRNENFFAVWRAIF